jgi:tripartite-type tricarboxylate transporter receptor subunit TctC
MQPLRFRVSIVHVMLLALSAGLATAQDFPSRPIRIVTSPAGGGSDCAHW